MSVDESGRRSYLPGAWFGIFGEAAAVLLPPTEKRRVAALWELLDDGADFDEVLDALIATGLRDLPGFLLVADTDDATRVVVRGAARATFETADGPVEVGAAGAGTWVERTVTGVTATVLEVPGADDDTDAPGPAEPMTVLSGLVRVSRVETPAPDRTTAAADDAPGSASPAGAAVAAAGGAGAAALAAAPLVVRDPLAEPGPALQADPGAPGDQDDGPAQPDPGAPESSAAAEPALEPALEPAPELAPELAPEPVVESAPEPEPVDGGAPTDTGEPTEMMSFDQLMAGGDGDRDAEPEEQPVEVPEPGADAGYDALSDPAHGERGAVQETPDPAPHEPTPHEPVGGVPAPGGPPAAPAFGSGPPPERPRWSPAPAPANPFAPGPPDGPDPDPAAPDGPPDAPTPAWGQDVPGAPVVDAPPADAPAPEDGSGPAGPEGPDHGGADHDGHTNAGDYDPSVYARSQPGIPGQPPAPSVTARPVARLLMSHGETVDVDRAILVGRAPEARRFTATDQPRLVTVPSPNQEISSTHLEVRPGSGADHGSAVVTDMGSTNGTVLVQPGLAPEDLQPGIAVQLIPGAVIDLGDGLTIQVANP